MKMTHKSDRRRRIDVAPDMVAMYRSQGWEVVTTPAKKSAPKPKAGGDK